MFGAKKDQIQIEATRNLQIPRHVAIIMDGNGRWARSRGLPRIEGHRRGAGRVRATVEETRRLGVRYLTLFCFSTENWNRPEAEVSALMRLFLQHLNSELELLVENNIRLRLIGNRESLAAELLSVLSKVEEKTQRNDGMDLILAVSYGGRDEITFAVNRIVGKAVEDGVRKACSLQSVNGLMPDPCSIIPPTIDCDEIRAHFYAPDVPDPDLLIRTSNESRISNFLLWQLAYSEIVVSEVLWPDFDREQLHICLDEFSKRTRRYGLTDDQLAGDKVLAS